jgi:DnaJ-class molecular chaperone
MAARATGARLGDTNQMKKPTANPTEQKCPACDGTGFPNVVQPAQPGRRIYPPPCEKCGGRGRVKEAAN